MLHADQETSGGEEEASAHQREFAGAADSAGGHRREYGAAPGSPGPPATHGERGVEFGSDGALAACFSTVSFQDGERRGAGDDGEEGGGRAEEPKPRSARPCLYQHPHVHKYLVTLTMKYCVDTEQRLR